MNFRHITRQPNTPASLPLRAFGRQGLGGVGFGQGSFGSSPLAAKGFDPRASKQSLRQGSSERENYLVQDADTTSDADTASAVGAVFQECADHVQTVQPTCGEIAGSDNIGFQSTYRISEGKARSQVGQAVIQASNVNRSINGSVAASKVSVLAADGLEGQRPIGDTEGNWQYFGASVNQNLKVDEVVEKIDSGQLWVVNSRRRNGIIVMREFHAEFAGPGAAVGGDLDQDIVKIIPIGNLSLLEPDSHEEHQNAIKIRLQWIRLTQNFTDQASPDDRARMILEQFKTYFDQATVDLVPDEAFAMLVGVLPQTIHRVRSGFVW